MHVRLLEVKLDVAQTRFQKIMSDQYKVLRSKVISISIDFLTYYNEENNLESLLQNFYHRDMK